MPVIETFREALLAAGKISLPAWRNGKIAIAHKKGPGDYATKSDLDAGAAMEAILTKELPDFPIVPEENKTGRLESEFRTERQKILASGSFILMDDLDATVRFRHGGEDWGHMLGLVHDGVLRHAALYLPSRDLFITAKRSGGCYLNGRQVTLDQSATITDGLLSLTLHKDVAEEVHREVTSRILYETAPSGCVCFNSNIGGIVRLLQGELCGLLQFGHSWDFVGALCITEAGGTAVAPTGDELAWQQIPMVLVAGANQDIADELLHITSQYIGYHEHIYSNPKFQN